MSLLKTSPFSGNTSSYFLEIIFFTPSSCDSGLIDPIPKSKNRPSTQDGAPPHWQHNLILERACKADIYKAHIPSAWSRMGTGSKKGKEAQAYTTVEIFFFFE